MHDRELDLTVVLSYEDPWWVARCLDVEVTSHGRTKTEALAMVREALELFFEDNANTVPPAPLIEPRIERLRVRVPT
ncbi:type II toxin-antitoxin system HicB family antitoxin [Yinghuangia seranimata]|uniref:type II toxin-antitoxin system HicB family antitoxin n=1 Tax=Yinghuangia seranimata TaxID=408067 RepID=UPI00248A90BD|nr:hypothetical protein [Yinghuangia seranimata]MDI2127394.1 hypothetical protein [Yinghuangia seranimata]